MSNLLEHYREQGYALRNAVYLESGRRDLTADYIEEDREAEAGPSDANNRRDDAFITAWSATVMGLETKVLYLFLPLCSCDRGNLKGLGQGGAFQGDRKTSAAMRTEWK